MGRQNHLEGAYLLYEGLCWVLQHVRTSAGGNLGQPAKGEVGAAAHAGFARWGQPWLHGSVTLSVLGTSSLMSQGSETVKSYHLQFTQRSK